MPPPLHLASPVSTRSFLAIPLTARYSRSLPKASTPIGVLVLIKLVPRPFLEFEVESLLDFRDVLAVAMARYHRERAKIR